jgi:multiple sugar transport system substrate-binding protein
MNFRAKGLAALTVVACLLSVGAAQAQTPIELQFWDQNWGPAEYPVRASALVDEFNKSQNEIRVTYRSVPWTSWYETYVTAVASGSAPDISTGAAFQAAQFFSMDAIYPVDELVDAMKADGTLADFDPASMEAVRYDGHYVALPWAIDIRALHYRKDILEAKGVPVPKTWDELRAAAKAVTGNGTYGLVSSGDPSGMHWTLAAMINNGGGLFDRDRKPALTSARSIEALSFLSALVADGSVNPASAGYTSDDARGAFLAGKAAFLLSNPNIGASAGDQAEKIGVMPPLAGPHGDKGTIAWVNNIMIYKQTKHPKETMKFLRWWSEHELPLFTEGHAYPMPARLSFQNDRFFTSEPHVRQVIEQYLPVAKGMAFTASGTFPELNEIDGDGFLMSMVQQIWQGVPTVDAVAPAQAHLEEIMAK